MLKFLPFRISTRHLHTRLDTHVQAEEEKMKHNLKNRPKPTPHDKVYDNYTIHTASVEEWFEGFEKELRERKGKGECPFQHGKCDRVSIKEILGDETEQ